ncbi:hypothetical protein FHR20_003139 [Sphingomonas leidyi]|jgi:hypothetical protein|uniref:Uncharacterized protein n=1 Tax=Sphingomonas leidyi TaxID=68569 RepID=A0A7X5ZWG1_9SPHN|nr:hypothetical protein [Sphingomonas leidyi]NIJ66177.1 hypothetical protein [Sphingomonas leidyi]
MLFALALLAAGQTPFPTRIGQCQWVRGGFYVANGSGINRLWVRGTKHVLNLHDGDERVPPAIRRFWSGRPFGNRLWGEFYVCALARYVPGHMQRVHILRTRRTLVTAR